MEYSTETSISSHMGLDEVIKSDKVRYVRKGYGLISALVIAIAFFTFGPVIMRAIWPSIEDYTIRQKIMMTLIPVHWLTYIIGNLMMLIIYKMKSPFFERYKIQSKPWPWEVDPVQWRKKVNQVGKNWLLNSCLGTLMCVVDTYIGIEVRADYDSLPGTLELIWQISFCMVCEDTCFYWGHRLLHHPKLYSKIHKKHHEFYSTVSFAAEYAHPLEFCLTNVLPSFVGMKLLGQRMHLATVVLWLFLRTFESIDGHSGYEFSWSPYRLLPLSGSSEFHNFHHSHNTGNFGSFFSYWDILCGTNIDFFRHKFTKAKEVQLEKLRENFKQDQKEKVQ